MTKHTRQHSYLIVSLLLAGSASCMASEDRRDDGSDLDFDNDKNLSARFWDSPEFAEYRRVSKSGDEAVDAYCAASDRPLQIIQLAEGVMHTDDGKPLLFLFAIGCEEGTVTEEVQGHVPLSGQSISGEVTTSNEGYVYSYSAWDADPITLDGTLSIYHAQQADAPGHLEVSIELPLVYQLAPRVNALPAATLVLRK